jgi:hypothetical protein
MTPMRPMGQLFNDANNLIRLICLTRLTRPQPIKPTRPRPMKPTRLLWPMRPTRPMWPKRSRPM